VVRLKRVWVKAALALGRTVHGSTDATSNTGHSTLTLIPLPLLQ
jgi:hypothetical protein